MARRTNKYEGVIPRLTKLPPENPSWQAKIDEAKAKITNRDPRALADSYIMLRVEKDYLKTQLSELELRVEAHEQLLTSSQESGESAWGRYGVKPNALRLANGFTIRIQKEPVGKVVDRELYRQWCLVNGYEREMMIWPTKTNSIIKERLVAGDPEPDGTEAHFYTIVKLIKPGAEE